MPAHELHFMLTDEQWADLLDIGRRQRSARNVIDPPGPWSDERHVRFAVQLAMRAAYEH